MALLSKAIVMIEKGRPDLIELKRALNELGDGEYAVLIANKEKNKSLTQMKYLWGTVLKMISEETGETTDNLYKYFELKYSPVKVVNVQGEDIPVRDMKRSTAKEMGLIIEQIIQFSQEELNIKIPTRDEMKDPEAQELYAGAYLDQWTDYNRKL